MIINRDCNPRLAFPIPRSGIKDFCNSGIPPGLWNLFNNMGFFHYKAGFVCTVLYLQAYRITTLTNSAVQRDTIQATLVSAVCPAGINIVQKNNYYYKLSLFVRTFGVDQVITDLFFSHEILGLRTLHAGISRLKVRDLRIAVPNYEVASEALIHL